MKRRFLLFAAPTIVVASSLMRVSATCLDLLRPVDWYADFYAHLRANPPPLTLRQQLALEVQWRTIANADQPLVFIDEYAVAAPDSREGAFPLFGAVTTRYTPYD